MSESSNIQISISALAEIITYDLSQPGRETAGLLIGYEINSVVHVDEIRIGEQKGNAVHVVISDEELTNAAIEVSNREDGKVIVGWWHSHPGLTAFLSSTDIKTQSLYQAFMPNAVAIVVDDVKYSQTFNLNDLDLGVFRVIEGQTQRLPYGLKDSVEFGLKTYIQGDHPAEISTTSPTRYVPVMEKEELRKLKLRISTLEEKMDNSDISAINAWIELAESMQDGTISEVPVDVSALNEKLNQSLGQIDDNMIAMEDAMLNKSAQLGLFAILFGVLLELIVFLFIVG